MGVYLTVVANKGREDEINRLYQKFIGIKGSWLVYSNKVIKSEILYIHSPKGESQAHLRPNLNSVKDWNHLFPAYRSGRRQFKISSLDEEDEIEHMKAVLCFVFDHRGLFSEIVGLEDAVEYGLCTQDQVDSLIVSVPMVRQLPVFTPGVVCPIW